MALVISSCVTTSLVPPRPQTGGTGLTITAADRVILVDPAWTAAALARESRTVAKQTPRTDVSVGARPSA